MNWSTNAPGTYTVRVGVFTAAWADNLHWNPSAGSFTVVAVPSMPTGLSASPISACHTRSADVQHFSESSHQRRRERCDRRLDREHD
jgi:hypothetical protein